MDDRLKQVQTTDLTDSRVNHEFVDWLKTKGMNWLLVLLLAACGYLAIDWYRNKQLAARDQAWAELASATSPAAFRGVAEAHGATDAVAEMALLQAADMLLNSIRTGLKPGFAATDEGATLTADERTAQLAEADALYAKAADRAGGRPGFAGKPIQLSAIFGRAAIAEADGRLDDARTHLQSAATLAAPEYESLAAQAEARIADLDLVLAASTLPSQASLPKPAVTEEPFSGPSAEDLLELFEDGDADPAADTGSTEDEAPDTTAPESESTGSQTPESDAPATASPPATDAPAAP